MYSKTSTTTTLGPQWSLGSIHKPRRYHSSSRWSLVPKKNPLHIPRWITEDQHTNKQTNKHIFIFLCCLRTLNTEKDNIQRKGFIYLANFHHGLGNILLSVSIFLGDLTILHFKKPFFMAFESSFHFLRKKIHFGDLPL